MRITITQFQPKRLHKMIYTLHKFQVLPKRWIVERTFAWLAWSRRLSKDYELHPTSAETMIHIAFAHLLLRRLA